MTKQENAERKRIYGKTYQIANKEKIAVKKREWLIANKEKISIAKKQYYAKNSRKHIIYQKEYRTVYKEKISKRRKEYYINNREKISHKNIIIRYGVEVVQINNIYENQWGICGICGISLKHPCNINVKKSEKLHIDHNHNTNKIRGLLCIYCNLGLGAFKDNIVSLENAIKYLNHFKV